MRIVICRPVISSEALHWHWNSIISRLGSRPLEGGRGLCQLPKWCFAACPKFAWHHAPRKAPLKASACSQSWSYLAWSFTRHLAPIQTHQIQLWQLHCSLRALSPCPCFKFLEETRAPKLFPTTQQGATHAGPTAVAGAARKKQGAG